MKTLVPFTNPILQTIDPSKVASPMPLVTGRMTVQLADGTAEERPVAGTEIRMIADGQALLLAVPTLNDGERLAWQDRPELPPVVMR